ncbi:hypothetical protein NDA14_006422 [Ustilago hordei]|nr:hypothetical protein NDA14_006422 [Ustilago hordei]
MGLSKFFRRALVCFQASDDTDNRSNANSKTRSADEAKEKDQSSVVEAQTAVGAQHGDQQKKTEEENATKNLADAPAQQTASTPTGPDQAIVDETAVTAVVTQSSIPKCECVHLRRKLLSRRYGFDEGYMFTEQPISTLKMTHEVALSLPSGERVTASQIDHANKAKIIEDLSPLAPRSQAELLDELRRQIQSYVDRNIGTLGQWRVVFASCRYTACMNASQSIFTGNVLVVTDAETMYSARIIPPAFQDIQPRRRYTAELPI